MLHTAVNLAGAVLRASPAAERAAFGVLRASDARPFRSLRFRLYKAWAKGLPADRAARWVALPDGVALRVDVRDFFGLAYVEPRVVESATADYLRAHLRPGDVFADVGANVGLLSLIAAARVGPTGHVWSFEPNPRLLPFLEESVARNGFAGRVTLAAVALADADADDRPFHLSGDPANSGLSSLDASPERVAGARLDVAAPIRVRAATFDTFAAQNAITRLDAVKVDVEGVEEAVMRGFAGAMARLRPRFVICETALDSPAARLIAGHGYTPRMLEAMDTPQWGNVLFTPTEAASAPA